MVMPSVEVRWAEDARYRSSAVLRMGINVGMLH